MKKHVLIGAILAALVSGVALAASEGGDTWSAVESVPALSYPATPSARSTEPVSPARDAALDAPEGFETWARVLALRETAVREPSSLARADRADATLSAQSGSEGGDTFSRFVPQPVGRSAGALAIGSAPAL